MKNVEDFFPLTPLQQGMLFHTLAEPAAGVYSEQTAGVLEGELDGEAFARAWQRLVDRHPALRTGFVWHKVKEPVQVVRQRVTAAVERLDWRGEPEGEIDARFAALAQAQLTAGFDLARPPLVRPVLVRTGEHRHRFLFTFHHILLDAWSMSLVLAELFAFYEAFRQGRDLDRPRPRPFRDYVAWLRKRDAAAAETFWRRELAGLTRPTELQDPAPERPGEGSGEAESQLSPRAAAALAECSRSEGITTANLALAAWALTLARHGGGDEVLFGTTLSGRPPELPGVEGMVGLFINTVPVRVPLPPAQPAGAWLRDLQARQARALAHAYAPLAEVHGWSEVPRGRPLFTSLTVFENAGGIASSRLPGGLTARPLRLAERAKFPLTAIALPRQPLTLRLLYDRRRYDETAARRLVGHWRHLLEALPASLARPLGELSPLSPPERHQLLAGWNDTAAPYPREESVAALVAARADERPDAVAVTGGDETWTYGAFTARARRLAGVLRRLGAGPEVPVAVCLERSVDLVTALAGTLFAGAAYVPFDPFDPADRRARLLADVAAPILVTRSEHLAPAGTNFTPDDGDLAILDLKVGAQLACATTPSAIQDAPTALDPEVGAQLACATTPSAIQDPPHAASLRAAGQGTPAGGGVSTPPRAEPAPTSPPAAPATAIGAAASPSPPRAGGTEPPELGVGERAGAGARSAGAVRASDEAPGGERREEGPDLSERAQRASFGAARSEAPRASVGSDPATAEGSGPGPLHPGGGPRVLLLDRLPESTHPDEAPTPTPAPGGDALAYILFTSGSTGRPKGVAVPHRGIVRLLFGSRFTPLGPDRTFLALAPAAFDASTLEIWGPLLHGGRLVLAPPEPPSPSALGELLARHRVTTLWLTAGLFQRVVEKEPALLASLERLLAGGDVLPPAAVRRLLAAVPGLTLVNGYGPTENTTFTCCHRVTAADAEPGPVPIGRPVAHTTAVLLDRRGRPVPAGVPGELATGGDGLARGYFRRPGLTAERFVPDATGTVTGGRLYRTGDRARHLADGRVEFLGRIDQQVKVRGFRVEPGEVEAVLAEHPAVAQAVVAAWGEEAGDRRLAAWWVRRAGDGEPSPAELRSFLAVRLPSPMVPSAFVRLDALPLGPTGKVDRRALPSPFAEAAAAAPAAASAPRTAVEEQVAAIWSEVLGVPQVGAHDGFFDLGGHSLLAMQVISQIQDRLGVQLSVRAVLEDGTVARVAAAVEEARRQEAADEAAAAAPVDAAPAAREADAAGPESPAGERRLPLSFGQERVWFLQRLDPASGLYNIPGVFLLTGRWSARIFADALAAVMRRHEALRTTFEAVEGKPVQVVAARARLDLATIDLSGLPEPVRRPALTALARAEAWRPFDLERGPLVRLCVVTLAGERHGLLLTMHHIISDGWSMGVLARELTEHYHAFLRGEAAGLPPLPLQYGDHTLRQRRELTAGRLEAELAWWRRRLAGLPPLLELPLDHPRPPQWSGRGAAVEGLLPAPLVERAGALARRHRTTLFSVLLAAAQAVLGRWSGSRDVAVASPAAGRDRGDLAGLIGFFVNTLALRTDLGGDPSFGELLERVRDGVLEALAHHELPFEKLVADLVPERNPAVTPLVQVLFAFQQGTAEKHDLGELELEHINVHPVTTKFDLEFLATKAGDGVWLMIEYATDLFDAATVHRLLARFIALLEAAAGEPGQRLSRLAPMPAAERHQLLFEWNDTAAEPAAGETLASLFARQAGRRPERIAAEAGDEQVSYGGLAHRAAGLAARLRRRGTGPEAVVAVGLERGLPLLTALAAVTTSGAAYLPLDPEQPPERLAFQLAESAAAVVIATAAPAPALSAAAARLLLVEGEEAGRGEPAVPAASAENPDPDHLAYVTYTSGSTGKPKGVAVPHRGVVRLVHRPAYVRLGPDEVVLQLAPVAFDAATFEVWGSLLAGGRLVVPPPGPPSLAGLGRLLAEHRVTLLHLTAGLFEQAAAHAPATLAPVRQLLTGGDMVPAAEARRLAAARPDLVLVHCYGPTEGTTFTTCERVEPGGEGPLPLGRPIAGTRVVILDSQARPVVLGAVGEIAIGGGGLARGYLARPAATAERFVPDAAGGAPGERLYRSGDLGRRRPDGRLEFLGRRDRQVKVRGFRVEPGEVEAVLEAHPAVSRAVVVPAASGLAAYAVPAPGAEPTSAELRRHLAARLPSYMVPASLTLLAELSLTARGKIDRDALPAPRRAGGFELPGVAPPARDPVEELVAGVFSEVLGHPVTAADDFFAAGGHSLLAIQALSRLEQVLGVEVPLRELFAAPTAAAVAARAAALRRDSRPGASAPIERRPRPAAGGEPQLAPASLGQRRLWFLAQLDPASPAYNMPLSLRLRGRLVASALAAALSEVARRHESLRTTFVRRGSEPWQRIHPPAPVPLPVADLSALPAAARDRLAGELAAHEAGRPYDLAAGPLLRSALLRLGEDDHQALLNVHHIVSDGWSMGVMVREIAALYAARRQGLAASPLPEPAVQYADFARWQRETQAAELDRQLDYWKRRLAGPLALLDLPADRPRPAVQSFRGGHRRQELPAELAAAVRALGRREGATLFMALLAAFALLLGRLTGQHDVRVGTPAAGRSRPELQGLVGFFVNTLVVRADLGGRPSFRQLLAQVKAAALEAFEHQDVPFERLVEALAPERDLARTPLFQVFFNMANLPRVEARLPDLTLEAPSPPEVAAKFDLTIYVNEIAAGGLQLDWVYNRDLFAPERMAGMAEQYRHLLEQLAARPEAPVAEHSLALPDGEAPLPDPAAELAPQWAEPVGRAFAAAAALHPDRVAVAEGEETLSYGGLQRAAAVVAARLAAAGVRRGEVVAVHALRSARLPEAVLGVLGAGAAFLLLDPSHPPARLARQLAIAGVRGWLELPGLPRPPEVEAALDELGVSCRLGLDGAGAAAPAETGSAAETASGAAPHPAELAYVAFTSGSSGEPRAVAGPHGPLARFLAWHIARHGFGAGDRVALLSGLGHDPMLRDLFTPLLAGGTLEVPDPVEWFTPGWLPAWMGRRRVTACHLTPSMTRLLAVRGRRGEGGPGSLADLRRAFFGGEALRRRDVERLRELAPAARIASFYGATETPQGMGLEVVDPDEAALDPVRLGRGIDGVQLLVLDRRGRPAGVGEVGEIAVRTPYLARGYLGDPRATAERFVPAAGGGRLYLTGDLGRFGPDGRVGYAGRADRQVKVRGFRVEPAEVERALEALPGVAAAAAAAREEPGGGGARLLAWVVPQPGSEPSPPRWLDALRRRLPEYAVPAAVVPLADLPLTSRGKVDVAALPDPEAAVPRPGAAEAPRSALERTLAAVFRQVLGLPEVGRHDRFFDLGGHSLHLVEVRARLEAELDREIPLPELFNHPTVAALAAHLEGGRAAATAAVEEVEERAGELAAGKARRLERRGRRAALLEGLDDA